MQISTSTFIVYSGAVKWCLIIWFQVNCLFCIKVWSNICTNYMWGWSFFPFFFSFLCSFSWQLPSWLLILLIAMLGQTQSKEAGSLEVETNKRPSLTVMLISGGWTVATLIIIIHPVTAASHIFHLFPRHE